MSIEKIKTISSLPEIVASLKNEGKTIVHCHGEFDLLHPGHIKHFEAAKKEGDILIVTFTPDRFIAKGPGRPVFNETIRAETIAAIGCVDYVAINQWATAVETIKLLKPNVYCKGNEYSAKGKDVTGRIKIEEDAVKSIGGRLHLTDEITFSSSNLINNHLSSYDHETNKYLQDLRKKYSYDEVISKIQALKDLKVLVIGDTIIDEYHYCSPLGKSPKNLIVSTKYQLEEKFAGGVLAATNHIAGFCNEVHLISLLGKKNGHYQFILENLKSNISTKFFHNDDSSTVIKRRYLDSVFFNKLFEICFLDEKPLPDFIENQVCEYIDAVIPNYDLVVVADFGHWFISPKIINHLNKKARFLAVNTQTNSANTGYNLIYKYPRADYVCIDEPEMRLANHDKFGVLEDLIDKTATQLDTSYTTVTMGHKGIMIHQKDNGIFNCPVLSTKVVDTIGAGDAVLSITSLCACVNFPPDLIGFIGNAVGALAVQIICNKNSIEPIPLYKFITALLK